MVSVWREGHDRFVKIDGLIQGSGIAMDPSEEVLSFIRLSSKEDETAVDED